MRTMRILILGFIMSSAALLGAGKSWATHGNAVYDCSNNQVIVIVTILGDTVTDNFDKAVYTIDGNPAGFEVDNGTVPRNPDGTMDDLVIAIPEGGSITGHYYGPGTSPNHPVVGGVPYTITGNKPVCEPATTVATSTTVTATTVPGSTPTTPTTAPGQGSSTSIVHNETTTTTDSSGHFLPATGTFVNVLVAFGLLALIIGALVLAGSHFGKEQ